MATAPFGSVAPRPELYDSGDEAFGVHRGRWHHCEGVMIDIHRASYSLTVTGEMVQLYDHALGTWFAFSIQRA